MGLFCRGLMREGFGRTHRLGLSELLLGLHGLLQPCGAWRIRGQPVGCISRAFRADGRGAGSVTPCQDASARIHSDFYAMFTRSSHELVLFVHTIDAVPPRG